MNERHDDHFGQLTPDPEWIGEIGRRASSGNSGTCGTYGINGLRPQLRSLDTSTWYPS